MFPDLIPADASARATPPARHTATPALFSPSERAERRFWEFFTAHIRNRNTRLAYLAAVRRFAEWCDRRGLALDQVEPMVVATYVEQASSQGLYVGLLQGPKVSSFGVNASRWRFCKPLPCLLRAVWRPVRVTIRPR